MIKDAEPFQVQLGVQNFFMGVGIPLPDFQGVTEKRLFGDVEAVNQPWTSMRNELGVLVDRNAFVNNLNVHLFQYLYVHKSHGFQALKAAWESAHLWQGKNVRLTAGAQHIEGQVIGVDTRGALRLLVEGVEHQYSGGELSLRLRDDS